MTRPLGKGMIPSVNQMTLINIRDRSVAPPKRLKPGLALLSVLLLVLLGGSAGPATIFAAEAKRTVPTDRPVSYEAFGAVGDGVADDLPAIVEAAPDLVGRVVVAVVHVRARGPSDELVRERVARLDRLPPAERDLLAKHHLDQLVRDVRGLGFADQQALASEFRAKGEHKRSYPSVDFVAQYGLFGKYNNFDDYFRTFQRHNATVGVAIKFPFLNFAQRGHAEAADAEALKARKQAEGVKEQVSSDTLRLQRLVQRLAAARDVAKLEYQLARSDVDAARARVEAGTASLRDEQAARVAENERYAAFLGATFELDRAQMQLLRATGDLEKWALP